MSTQTRALLIGLSGPALSALGAAWVLVNVAIDSGRELTLRYLIFDPGHLVIAVGILTSAVCIPVAFQVAAAAPEDVELELFEPEEPERTSAAPVEVPAGSWETTK